MLKITLKVNWLSNWSLEVGKELKEEVTTSNDEVKEKGKIELIIINN